jgi:protein-S-isoprenylcysteine O-methyltransferase Ste14
MYVAAPQMLAGIPILLGSWWGSLRMLAVLPVLIWRLLDEERFLDMNLPGYRAYQDKVRYPLFPPVW